MLKFTVQNRRHQQQNGSPGANTGNVGAGKTGNGAPGTFGVTGNARTSEGPDTAKCGQKQKDKKNLDSGSTKTNSEGEVTVQGWLDLDFIFCVVVRKSTAG